MECSPRRLVISRFPDSLDIDHRTLRVANGGVDLHAEVLTNPAARDPQRSVLLLSEAEAPSSRWPDQLLLGLAEQVGQVCWFDTRDVGASSWVDEPYALTDLAEDAFAVLEAIGAGPVDLIGRSMGGEVALRMALTSSARLRSLMLLSSTPGRRDELGLPEQWLIERMSERLFKGEPNDDESRARWIVDQLEWFNGPVFAFDRQLELERAREEVGRGWRGSNGHGIAVMEADDVVDELRSLDLATTVLHGTADPVLPVEHGRALNLLIEGSALVLIEGLGHELPRGFVPSLLDVIGSHLSSS